LDGFSGTNCEIVDPIFAEEVLVSSLEFPHGMELDSDGNLWITTPGEGDNDGKIQVITPTAEVFDFMIKIPSQITEGTPASAHGILINGDDLWVALGIGTNEPLGGKLLKLDISGYQPGNASIEYDEANVEADITSYTGVETNIHGLTIGSGGNIYIADAGSNSILVYDINNKNLSTFAFFTLINGAEAVPTSIVYDSNSRSYFVTAFAGFPFNSRSSVVYTLNEGGTIVSETHGFTGAIDLIQLPDGSLMCLEYGSYDSGFVNNTGKLSALNTGLVLELQGNLSYPTSLVSDGGDGYFVTSRNANGSIIHLTPL
jgi:hypothetical protein